MKDKILYIIIIVLCLVFLLWNFIGSSKKTITYEYNTEEYSHVCSDYDLDDKGLFYDENLNKYFITLGLKSSGGYSIDIEKIDIDKDGNVSIVVLEKEPPDDAIVTMALTCPTIDISFSEKPKSITVSNTLGEQYK